MTPSRNTRSYTLRSVPSSPGRSFFGVRQIRLNGIISPQYHEVTLDTFGFPVGGRLAARRAVSRPRLPKVALFGPKNAVFLAGNHFFVHTLQFLCYHHDQTPKRQRFRVVNVAEQAPGGLQEPFFGPKMAWKSDFYAFHCIAWHRMVLHGISLYLMVSHSFHVIPLYRMVLHGIVLYLTVLHGIALLGSARGLYLARHLSTLY